MNENKKMIIGYSELCMHCKVAGKEALKYEKTHHQFGKIWLKDEPERWIDGILNVHEHPDMIWVTVS